MAIVFDNATFQTDSVSQAMLTYSHVTGTGPNRILFVGVSGALTDTLSGITYAGVAMTVINKVQEPGGRFVYLYYLVNPTSGSNAVIVTLGSATNVGSAAVSYIGAQQASQPDNNNTSTSSGATSVTASVTTVADNCWTVFFSGNTQGAMSAGTGSTARTTGTNGYNIYDSNAAITPAGSYSMTTTWSTNGGGGCVIASFVPSASSGGGSTLAMMGV